MRPHLTDKQIEYYRKRAPQFTDCTAGMLFGANAVPGLSNRVAMSNILRWRELRRQWAIQQGEVIPPVSFYH